MKLQHDLTISFLLVFSINPSKAQDDTIALSNQEILGKAKAHFETNQCFPKGGLGMVSKNLYIVLNTTQNELKIPNGKDWIGGAKEEKEVVIIFGGRVFATSGLPSNYRLNESVLISFEAEKVVFFDFGTLDGGFYRREQ